MQIIKKALLAVALLAFWLYGADRAQQIADVLKTKSGQTLNQTVLFVKYGSDAFDWLVVTPDGKFAAKLEGMNGDGTFRYTILGNPADYGLKLNVTLSGVTIQALAPTNQADLIASKNTASATIRAVVGETVGMIVGSATSMTRSTQNPSLLQLALQNLSHKNSKVRATQSQPCPNGGDITISTSGSSAVVKYNNCIVGTTEISGELDITQTGSNSARVVYKGFIISAEKFYITVPSATLDMIIDLATNQLRSYTFHIVLLGAVNIETGDDIALKDYTIKATLSNNIMRTTLNGKLKSNCMSEDTTISTTSPIVQDIRRICPNSGVIIAKNSTSDVKIVFGSTGSVDVIDNKTGSRLEHYDNCLAAKADAVCH